MNSPLHVEVVQKRSSQASGDHLEAMVRAFLGEFRSLTAGAALSPGGELAQHAECVTLCDVEHGAGAELPPDTPLVLHAHRLHDAAPAPDALGDDEPVAAELLALPARALHGLWESLAFESRLKEDAVRYVETAFRFVERGVDPLVVGWNRVVLLHGPPGTGKTSLCRALAHKLSVRLGGRFARARLVEINAHGLFSKWFAESGKLVARLFERVHDMAADERLLLVVLLDEVESLAHARRAALHGLEPSDSIRAVNALLAQLDRLRRRPNALVLTTSNVTGAIDVAFADRADLKRRVGPPPARAAYEILRGCCGELAARGVLAPGAERLFAARALEGSRWAPSAAAEVSLQLWAVAQEAARARLSGRALRRLPFLASALHTEGGAAPSLAAFVRALEAALEAHRRDADDFRDDEDRPREDSPVGCNY